MSRRRTLCFALAAILTSSALPALAAITIPIENNTTFGDPVKVSTLGDNDVIIKFDTKSGDSITLIADGQSWDPDKTAVLVDDGYTLTLDTTDAPDGVYLNIFNATVGGIINHQSGLDAKLDLGDLASLSVINNSLSSSDTGYMGGGGISILSESNKTELVISNDAEMYINTVTIGGAASYSGGGAAYAAAKGSKQAASITVGGMSSYADNSFFALNSVTIGGAANHSGGGALAAFSTGTGIGGNASIIIADVSNFDYNTVTLNSNSNTLSGGGAILVYAAEDANLNIGKSAYFGGNSVISANGGYNGGGAIHASSDKALTVEIGQNALFHGNRADVGADAQSGGGAIWAASGSGSGNITLTGRSSFENNSTSGKGGAIYVAGGTAGANIDLNTHEGNIVFRGNRDGVTYDENGAATGGTANAIHLDGEVNILSFGGNDIFFDDPITSGTSGTTTLHLGDAYDAFTGMAQFKGLSNFTGDITSAPGGLIHLADGATIEAKTINLNRSDISGQGTLIAAESITISGRIKPDSDVFNAFNTSLTGVDKPMNEGLGKALNDYRVDVSKKSGQINLTAGNGYSVTLNGATLSVDLDKGGISSDKLVVNDLDAASRNNVIDITTWNIGEYTIMQADSGNITVGSSLSDTFWDADNNGVTVGGLALAGRMAGTVTLNVINSGSGLTMTTINPVNTTLTWNNAATDDWNFSDANWTGGATTFAAGDNVIFDDTATPGIINVAGKTDATNAYSVQVGDMEITENGYSFKGGAIIGRANNDSGATGKLAINGVGVNFNNTLDFEDGIDLTGDALMHMNYATDLLHQGGFISDNTTVNIDSSSALKFNFRLNNDAGEHIYAHNGEIAGEGRFIVNLTDKNGTGGYMMLTADNKDFEGTIEVLGYGTGGGSGLYLTRPTAAGTAGIKLENNGTNLNLDFDPTDTFTYNFTNQITATANASNTVNIYGGRVALGGVENFGGTTIADGSIVVHDGGALAFRSDDSTQTNAYTVGGHVEVRVGGVIVGGQGGSMTGTLEFNNGSILELAAGNEALKMDAGSTLEVVDDNVGKRLKATDTWTAGQSYAILDVSDVSTFNLAEKPWLAGDLSTAVSRGVLEWNNEVLYYNHIGSNTISELAYEAGFSSNQRQTAKGVDSLNHNGSLYNTVANLNRGDVAPALDQLSGQPIAAAAGIARQNATSFNNSVISQSRSLRGSLAAKGSGEPYFKTIPARSSNSAPAASPAFQPPRATANNAAGQLTGLTYSPEAVRTIPDGVTDYQTVAPDGRSLQPSFGWADDEPLTQVWLSLGYDRTSYDAAGGHHAATARGPQAAIGLEHSFDNEWFVGAAFHYANQEIKQSKFSAETDIDAFTIGLYGGREAALGRGALRLTMGAGYSFFNIDAERKVRIPGLTERLTADYDGHAWQLFGEAAYGFRLTDYLDLEPYLNLSYVHQKIDGFREHGGTSALKAHSQSDDDFYTTLGGRLSAALGSSTTLELDLGWQHRFGDRWGETTMSFAQGSTPFTIEAAAPDRDLAQISLGLNQAITESLAMKLNYNGAYGSDSRRHGGQAMISYSF